MGIRGKRENIGKKKEKRWKNGEEGKRWKKGDKERKHKLKEGNRMGKYGKRGKT